MTEVIRKIGGICGGLLDITNQLLKEALRRNKQQKQHLRFLNSVFSICVQEVLISCVWAILSDDIEANDSIG